jgi:outer membrane immunogenic protein
MFMPNWSLKAEALYYNLGSVTFTSGPVGAVDPDGTHTFLQNGVTGALLFANTPTTRVKYDGVIARVGVNYHFNWGTAPVIAKF